MKNIFINIVSILTMQIFYAQNFKPGLYIKKNMTDKIEFKNNGSYILYNVQNLGHLALDQCDTLSIGQWKIISNDILDLTSENYYKEQLGYKYELEKSNKGSQDSIYIDIKLSDNSKESIPTPEFNILFNYKTAKQIKTKSNKIRISKKEYFLFGKNNRISLDLVFKTSGKVFYSNRLKYNILQDYALNLESNNFFTINLPYFNQCFFYFEPYYHSYIYIKDKNTLIWKGEEWIKK
ncbi:hypothetical protein [Chryseobacterium luquanense]|uniref:Uncharacterized protein n=1 Tax=Chryseobacterium luquanense TaxID=2983766 RepID=A0ABT3Y1U1_9FLAO|nr:hypothetical protein [Chryseobacterium luquanense]MCX8532082.1 hypothetical protein [Chryseobacterium luquanense]